ncbi:MAG: ABC transporter permease [Clostridiales bacterium]|nr:ABC transporter permease [Clostridiales bacterium]
MSTVAALIKRNVKLFFKDKGMFFTALVTPGILLVLYSTFLGNVYKDTYMAALPQGFILPEKIIDGLVGGQLVSSILAVSCVTVAFCSNFLMVQDKVSGVIKDLTMSPVKPYQLSLAYYVANLVSTLIICLGALCLGLGYLAIVGWYLSVADVFLLLIDVIVLVLFGTALSSLVNFFLNTQGQLSAVGTVISAGYGFICGAYMPISTFSEGLQKVLSFLPGTYGTSLVRSHCVRGALEELVENGVHTEIVEAIKASLDLSVDFFGQTVEIPVMYIILLVSIFLFLGGFVLANVAKHKKR